MESHQHCAYNRTRESFLALDVTAGEFTFAMLENYLPTFKPKPGAGMWLVPFRGIPSRDLPILLDLLYLDVNCCVLDIVESFPAFGVSGSRPPAASVLVLPAHSLSPSQTKPGDQLLLCPADEMSWRLQQVPAVEATSTVGSAAADPELRGRQQPDATAHPQAGQLLVEPAVKRAEPPKNWLKRLLYPDPPDNRYAARQAAPGLAAYFFTGGTPQAHTIRDISPTGLYIVTAERWYPGTLVRLTLTNTGGEPSADRSISVHAVAVRWGNDGVGLQFVVQDTRRARAGQSSAGEGVDAKQLAEFLDRLTRSFPDGVPS